MLAQRHLLQHKQSSFKQSQNKMCSSVHTWLIGGYSNHSRSGKSSCTTDQNRVTHNVFHCSSLLADRLNTDLFFLSAALLLKDLHLCSMWIYIMLNFFFSVFSVSFYLRWRSRMDKSEKEAIALGRILIKTGPAINIVHIKLKSYAYLVFLCNSVLYSIP